MKTIKIFFIAWILNIIENLALLYYNKIPIDNQQTIIGAVIFALAVVAVTKLLGNTQGG